MLPEKESLFVTPRLVADTNDIEVSELKRGDEEEPSIQASDMKKFQETIDDEIYYGPVLPKLSPFFDITTVSQEQVNLFINRRLEAITQLNEMGNLTNRTG